MPKPSLLRLLGLLLLTNWGCDSRIICSTAGAQGSGGAPPDGGVDVVATGGTGGGGVGGAGGNPSVCTRTEACPVTCPASSIACLHKVGNEFPVVDSVTVDGTITSVVKEAWTWPYQCVGGRSPFGVRPTERVLIKLQDAQGAAWELSLPPELVSVDRFPATAPLSVNFQSQTSMLLIFKDRLLTVSEPISGLALFFVDAYSTNAFPLTDAGLVFGIGGQSCPYSTVDNSGCSTAQFATTVSDGTTSKSSPCRTAIGRFAVTSGYQSGRSVPDSCGPHPNACDAPNQFIASGVRTP